MDIKKEYERWLAKATADADVAAELKTLDDAKIEDAFYRDLEGKHAAVPESTLCNVVLCHFLRGLFLEHGHLADLFLADGDDIAVFLAGVGRLNAHQDQICTADSGTVSQCFQCLKVVILHIGVHRADDNGFFLADALHVLQIGGSQRNSRGGIA